MLWMVGAYFFQTVGELMLSPVGLDGHQARTGTPRLGADGSGFSNAAETSSPAPSARSEGHGDATVFLGIALGSAAAGAILFALGRCSTG
jgi:hypothetical protein